MAVAVPSSAVRGCGCGRCVDRDLAHEYLAGLGSRRSSPGWKRSWDLVSLVAASDLDRRGGMSPEDIAAAGRSASLLPGAADHGPQRDAVADLSEKRLAHLLRPRTTYSLP